MTTDAGPTPDNLPFVSLLGGWEAVLRESAPSGLTRALLPYVGAQRWFGGKARTLKSIHIQDAIPVPYDRSPAQITIVRAEFAEGDPDTYLLPLAVASLDEIRRNHVPMRSLIARTETQEGSALLYDPTLDRSFGHLLVELIRGSRHLAGMSGTINGIPAGSWRSSESSNVPVESQPITQFEQSNSSIVFGQEMILKLFRRLAAGINPDVEIGRHLTERVGFPHTPAFLGTLEYRSSQGTPTSLGILQRFVPGEGDAWTYTLNALTGYFERAAAAGPAESAPDPPQGALACMEAPAPPTTVTKLVGPYLDSAQLLGVRSAELHVVLASDSSDPAFAPNRFDAAYQRELNQSIRTQAGQSLLLLRGRLDYLPPNVATSARELLQREQRLLDRIDGVFAHPFDAVRIRCHGDYHLGQVLRTGDDFVIIDFEGEPAQPLAERRAKHSSLQDVAGMLRSFAYAAQTGRRDFSERNVTIGRNDPRLAEWAQFWQGWVSAAFLHGYFSQITGTRAWPAARDDLQDLLDVLILNKACYELRYELNNRPDWSDIPVANLLQLTAATRA